MNTETGEILRPDEFAELRNKLFAEGRHEEAAKWKPMSMEPTDQQMSRKPPKVGRNEPCPCGSGKKFKKCCLSG